MGIIHSKRIKLPEVNAEPERSIFLVNKYHSIAPGAIAGSDHTRIQHHLQMSTHLVELRRWNSTESLLESGSIGIFQDNFVLGSLGVPHVMLL